MKSESLKRLALTGCVLVASGGAWLWITARSDSGSSRRPQTEDATLAELSQPSERSASVTDRSDSKLALTEMSFTERLEATKAIADPTRRRLREAEIFAEWIEKDFRSAFGFLSSEGFRSLSLPGIAQMIANRATLSDLITLTNKVDLPADALMAIGRYLKPAQLLEIADATHLIDHERIPSAAGVLAGLMAAQNLDSALQYAASLEISEGGAAAYAGIIDQLSANNSAEQARDIFSALPEEVQSQDPVLFAYGNAVRDSDPNAAIEALSSIHDGQYRTLALVAFSRKVEASSPAAAIQAIVNGLGERGFQNHVPRIIRTWSAHDPAAARSFLEAATWMTGTQRSSLLGVVDASSRAGEPAP